MHSEQREENSNYEDESLVTCVRKVRGHILGAKKYGSEKEDTRHADCACCLPWK